MDDRTESEYEKGGSSLSDLPHDEKRMAAEDERHDFARYEDAPQEREE